jgi:hypothetical protein
MRTRNATAARMARYDSIARAALPHIEAARTLGIKNARGFAAYLNANCVAAPSGSDWTDSAVLRFLRKLKDLGLDSGSLRPQQARTYGGPRKAHVQKHHVKMPDYLSADDQKWLIEQLAKIAC